MGFLIFIILCIFGILLLFLGKRIGLENLANLFIIYWIVNLGVALALFNITYTWHWWGLNYLLLCVSAFSISFLCVGYKTLQNKRQVENCVNRPRVWTILLWLGFIASMLFVVVNISANGFSVFKFTSLDSLIEAGTFFSEGRYGNQIELEVPLFGQICLTVNYANFIVAGYVYRLRLTKKYLCILPFCSMMIDAMVTTSKTGLISGMMLWISGYLVAKNYNFIPPKSKISKLSVVLLLLVIGAVFYGSFYVRYGGTRDMQSIWNRIITYALGHVPCYDDWFSKFPINLWGYAHGQRTFMFLFGHTPPGALLKVAIYPIFFTRFGWTNVMTMFADVIMDFGIIGGIFFFIIWGGLLGLAYRVFLTTGSAMAQACLGLGYYIILYSFLVSPMRYLSIVGAFFLFGIYLLFIRKGVVLHSSRRKEQK